jgi:hypothetical protein
MIVMRIAITPSLNASTRFFVTAAGYRCTIASPMSLRLTSGGGCAAALLWALALAWCGGIAFFALVVARSDAAPPLGAWIALGFFAAVGLHLLTLAVRATRSAAALRNASVEIERAAIGAKLAGAIALPDGHYLLTLTNWRLGDSDELLWESPALTVAKSGPFAFDVPFDTEPTSPAAAWRLILETADGRNSASFAVTVERTAESSPARTQRALRAVTYDEPAVTKVDVDRGAASTTVRFPLPAWLWRWYVIVAALAGAGYLAATYVYRDGAMIAITAGAVVVLSLMPLPALAMTVRRIDAGRGGLTLHYVLLRRAKRIEAPHDVDAVYADGALHYELAFEGTKPSWTIVNLRTRREADWVAYELRRAIGIS